MICFEQQKEKEEKKYVDFHKELIGGSDIFFNKLATHLPDQVVYFNHEKKLPFQRTFQGVLMFLDISGFTSLCEKFALSAKYGTDKLTKTLSTYMGSMVQEILKYDGDVMKYAGDAILTLWPVQDYKMMKATVQHVIQCALNIQKNYGIYHTSVGVKLKVKLGIAAGQISLLHVGNGEFCHYITMGRAVGAVNGAEGFCVKGDTVVAPSAWCFVNAENYVFNFCEDEKHVKVTDIASNKELDDVRHLVPTRTSGLTRSAQQLVGGSEQISEPQNSSRRKSVVSGTFDMTTEGVGRPVSPRKESTPGGRTITGDHLQADEGENVAKKTQVEVEQAVVRRSVVQNHGSGVNEALRLYIAPPVIKKLDDKQPLEYLSEMREVSILFINLKTKDTTKVEGCILLQKCFEVIFTDLKSMGGCMNKIFVFDKGCTFLAIFGLPGYKTESDCAKALQCAYRIKAELDEFPMIERTSIGVTSGLTYCGVVGHDHRHEYTVIGRKVNMAARLMMHYPAMVTCDQETYHNSKLSKVNFVAQELKQMKGLQQVGTIREFQERETDTNINLAMTCEEFEFPVVGRNKEVGVLTSDIQGMKADADVGLRRIVLAYEGNPGTGKSRLTGALKEAAKNNNARTVGCALTIHDTAQSYLVIRTVLIDLLELEIRAEDSAEQQREMVLSRVRDPGVRDNISLLTDLLFSKTTTNIDENSAKIHEGLNSIMKEVCAKHGFVVVVVDDAHHMDAASWAFLEDLGRDPQSLVVLTYRPKTAGAVLSDNAQTVLGNETTKKVVLKSLQPEFIAPLACQLLKVREIPLRLNNLLEERSRGLPLWCEQLLLDMFYAGTIYSVDTGEAVKIEKMVKPDPKFLKVPNFDKKKLPDVMCLIDREKAFEVGIPDLMKGSIFSSVDQFQDSDQTLIKHAAILGMSFPREMLESILPCHLLGNSMTECLARLMQTGYLECATKNPVKRGLSSLLVTDWPLLMGVSKSERDQFRRNPIHCYTISDKVQCECPNNLCRGEPDGYKSCCFLRFTSSIVQETVYEMSVEDARVMLHKKAALFLEGEAVSCEVCGRSAFYTDGSNDVATVRTPIWLALRTAGTSEHNEYDIDYQTGVSRQYDRDDLDEMLGRRKSDVKYIDAETTSTDARTKECECQQMLSMLFPELVRHWRFVGNVEKTISHLMEAGATALSIGQIGQANGYLAEVNMMLHRIRHAISPFDGESPFNKPVHFDEFGDARLEMLLGQALHQAGSEKEALGHFIAALNILGNQQPETKLKTRARAEKENCRRLFYATFPSREEKITEESGRAVVQLEARCLAHLSQLYIKNGEKAKAMSCSLQQINRASILVDPVEMIVAQVNRIQFAVRTNDRAKARANAEAALKIFSSFPDELTKDELVVGCHLCMTLLNMYLSWGDLGLAIDTGLDGERMTRLLREKDIRMQLLPSLCQAVLLKCRVRDCGLLIEELNEAQFEDKDMQGRTWYFTCVVMFLLRAGYLMEPVEKFEKFAVSLRKDHSFLTDQLVFFLFASCMALWYARRFNVTKAEDWLEVALTCFPNGVPRKLHAAQGYIYLLEAALLQLCTAKAHEIGRGTKKLTLPSQKKQIKKMFKEAKRMVVVVSVFKPRLLLLEAYHAALLGETNTAALLADDCGALAQLAGNTFDMVWASENRKWWMSPLEAPQIDFGRTFKNWFNCHTTASTEMTLNRFLLPLPKWIASTLPEPAQNDAPEISVVVVPEVKYRGRRGAVVSGATMLETF